MIEIIVEMTDFRYKCANCGKKADLERNGEHYCFRCNERLFGKATMRNAAIKFRFKGSVVPAAATPFTMLLVEVLRN